VADNDLAGTGVLVTRPKHQATELVAAIEAHGGSAFQLPVLEIIPRAERAVAEDSDGLGDPDIAIFVSSNAANYGLPYAGTAKIAVVGPATAAAVKAAGRSVDVRSEAGYDSEHLLATPELRDVDGKSVRIIRGNDGRELLADTLRERGATVDYLAVYDRAVPQYPETELDELVRQWRSGAINVVTIMSVESLRNLVSILPDGCRTEFENTLLVTPATRVIKEALNQFPGIPTTLARGTQASEMVKAIIRCKNT